MYLLNPSSTFFNTNSTASASLNYDLINQINDKNILLTFRDNSFYVLNLELLNSKNNIELRDVLKLNSNLKSNKIKDKSYDYNIIEYQKFSVKNYKKWLTTIDKTKRF